MYFFIYKYIYKYIYLVIIYLSIYSLQVYEYMKIYSARDENRCVGYVSRFVVESETIASL